MTHADELRFEDAVLASYTYDELLALAIEARHEMGSHDPRAWGPDGPDNLGSRRATRPYDWDEDVEWEDGA